MEISIFVNYIQSQTFPFIIRRNDKERINVRDLDYNYPNSYLISLLLSYRVGKKGVKYYYKNITNFKCN